MVDSGGTSDNLGDGMKNMPSRLFVVATVGVLLISIGAQAQDMQLKFDAASIKRNSSSDTSFPTAACHGTDTKEIPREPARGGGLGAAVGLQFPTLSLFGLGRCNFNSVPLKDLIAGAYGVEITDKSARVT